MGGNQSSIFNTSVVYLQTQVCMVMLAMLIPSLEKGMWFTSLDKKDTYFHIDIHPAHRRFLRFIMGTHHFRYRVLPFGIATRVFTKVFSIVVDHIRYYDDLVFPYLDNWLLVSRFSQEAHTSTSILLSLLSSLRVSVNFEKSILHHTQSLDVIGATINSVTARFYLATDRFQTVSGIVTHINSNLYV